MRSHRLASPPTLATLFVPALAVALSAACSSSDSSPSAASTSCSAGATCTLQGGGTGRVVCAANGAASCAADAIDAGIDASDDDAAPDTTADAAPDTAPDATPEAEAGPVTCTSPLGCTAAVPACGALVDGTALSTWTLRVSELDVTKPAAFASGVFATTLGNATQPSSPTCGLHGQATLNWLLELSSTGVRIGGAKPVADPTQGYTFVDETVPVGPIQAHVGTLHLQGAVDTSGAVDTMPGGEVYLPVYLDAMGTQRFLVPLQRAELHAKLDTTRSCIGQFNASNLDPANGCAPTDPAHPFTTAGTLRGVISTMEADFIVIPQLGETLCVLLAGAQYGDGATPVQHCKTQGGVPVATGDTCSDATSNCLDAWTFEASIAASGVKRN